MSSSRLAVALTLGLCVLAGRAHAQAEPAGGLPWIVFVRVTNAPPGAEARLADAVTKALLRSEANVVESAELVKAAAARGIAKARWADVGALNQVAQQIGADYLLFATVRFDELELFTLSRAGEIGGAERVALGRRASPPAAAELDQALARLLAKLPRTGASTAPTPPIAVAPPAPDPAVTTPPVAPTPSAPVASSSSPVNPAAAAAPSISPMKIGLFVGAGVLGTAGGCAVALGVVTGMDAMAQSNAILTLPKESPVRTERERASLDTAVMADVSHGAAVVLIGAAVGVAVWALMIE